MFDPVGLPNASRIELPPDAAAGNLVIAGKLVMSGVETPPIPTGAANEAAPPVGPPTPAPAVVHDAGACPAGAVLADPGDPTEDDKPDANPAPPPSKAP